MNNGARSLGMGNAFVALSDQPTSIFSNPAGLARINQFYLVFSHQNLYGIRNLYNDMIAISFPTPLFRTAIGIQQINLLHTYSEKIIYFSSAGIINPNNIPIRFGMNLKYESVKVYNYENAQNPSSFDMDLGLQLDVNEMLFIGYSMMYILEPKFKFISMNTKINRKSIIGICYNWRKSVNFLIDYVWENENPHFNLGSEIWFYNIFSTRLGMSDERLTSGFGLHSKQWIIDAAVIAHEQLGSNYRISFGLKLGSFSK